ncbi:ATP-binding protein [Tsuneonella mangrovi]|uniref:ATP-binding protein n=1 Tax=Tsuneonella mangrovi TaxID=1982042 RepID=UPI000BA26AA5|nr:ATP-binding protein [Tsuneonella mangrovi]
MDDGFRIPWFGILVALLGSGIAAIAARSLVLGIVLFVAWAGSLVVMVLSQSPPAPSRQERGSISRSNLSELIEHSGTPLLLTDRNRITIANEAAREVLGGHIVGQDVRVALRQPEAIALIDKAEAGSTTVKGLSRRRDIWRISRQPMDGDSAMIELINRTSEADISRAHTDFVANASHELRTPIASIIGYVETLADGGADEATANRFYDTILREAHRLQSLVSDLMSLSRVEAEKHEQPSARINLGELVPRAARDAAGPDRLDKLAIECAPGIAIRGDQLQLEQLVRNLVDNALKYGSGDDPVKVNLSRSVSGEVRLSIADSGEGIPAEHLPHLTRRFYRTDPGRSRASGGTGLGLAIVKHIVERHRGRLDIASKVGIGTTVTVRITELVEEPDLAD